MPRKSIKNNTLVQNNINEEVVLVNDPKLENTPIKEAVKKTTKKTNSKLHNVDETTCLTPKTAKSAKNKETKEPKSKIKKDKTDNIVENVVEEVKEVVVETKRKKPKGTTLTREENKLKESSYEKLENEEEFKRALEQVVHEALRAAASEYKIVKKKNEFSLKDRVLNICNTPKIRDLVENNGKDEYISLDEIYGLYSIDPDCDLEEYIHAISLETKTLEKLFEDNVSAENRQKLRWEIKPIDIFNLLYIDDPSGLIEDTYVSKKLFGDDKNYIMVKGGSVKVKTIYEKMYAHNLVITIGDQELCRNVLVNVHHDSSANSKEFKNYLNKIKKEPKFIEDISEGIVKFDKYYEDGIMSA